MPAAYKGQQQCKGPESQALQEDWSGEPERPALGIIGVWLHARLAA